MSRIALCLALLCLITGPARALQLGETREQLVAKHGAPGAEDHARNLAAYFWEGWSARLEFQGDTVARLTYRRNYYLQEAEITSLLDSNGGASRWREVSSASSLDRQWSRDDGATATCARNRPVSIVFQTAKLAAAYQQGPKVVVPATPQPQPQSQPQAAPAPLPTYTKTPSFPKMLGTVPEPELPVADAPPVAAPLPKLPAADLEPEPRTAPEPKPVAPAPVTEKKPAAEPAATAPASGSHALAYVLGALALSGAAAGGGWYFHKRRSHPPGSALPVKGRAAAAPTPVTAIPGLETLRPDQVELLIGEIYRREGYTVELSAALNTDTGIDLMLRRDGETTLVQCKHWSAPRVTAREVRDFYGAMAEGGAPHGVLVTSGIFTPDVAAFIEGKGIELLDGAALQAKIEAAAKPGENFSQVSTWLEDFIAHARIFDPECPVCQSTMVIRHNRASGAPSWSCRSYPRCPGRREPRLDLLPSTTSH